MVRIAIRKNATVMGFVTYATVLEIEFTVSNAKKTVRFVLTSEGLYTESGWVEPPFLPCSVATNI